MKYIKRAWAEIHLERLKENTANFTSAVNHGRKESENSEIMCVVKADCYGHGSVKCAKYLQDDAGIKYFAVSNLDEAVELREGGITGDILILGYTSPVYASAISEYGIIQTITDENYAGELSESAKTPVRCHIKLDTGMTRIGLRYSSPEEYSHAVLRISRLKNLEIEGIFTHLCVADSKDPDDVKYTKNQIKLIKDVKDMVLQEGVFLKHCHFLNSAGGIFYSDPDSTLARLGIILYGLYPDRDLVLPFDLCPVMEVKAVVSQVKEVEEGVCVSYGRTYVTKKKTKLATVAIGYADGVPRLLSNKGEMLIKGKRAPIVGRVCMDQLMLDVTGIDVKEGDIAVLFGTSGNERITADDIASLCDTIGYEIVCGISKRVPRVYL